MNLNIKNNQSFANEGLYLQIFAYFVIYISLYINSLLADAGNYNYLIINKMQT